MISGTVGTTTFFLFHLRGTPRGLINGLVKESPIEKSTLVLSPRGALELIALKQRQMMFQNRLEKSPELAPQTPGQAGRDVIIN